MPILTDYTEILRITNKRLINKSAVQVKRFNEDTFAEAIQECVHLGSLPRLPGGCDQLDLRKVSWEGGRGGMRGEQRLGPIDTIPLSPLAIAQPASVYLH